ncbi:MAG: prepilin-type N-terminal cleavage/methylation domain-containing protein [Planctomycetes bacterium]|nr:prepilin-type N-terminal cleavage/methylation domain-containing protein [Planctomycetota bacterium]
MGILSAFSNGTRRAFTLIELLVVIAIIAILAAMLMPALENAQRSAKRAQCTGNLHQQSLAFSLYANDFNGFWPYRPDLADPDFWEVWRGGSGTWDGNRECIEPYLQPSPVYSCPLLTIDWRDAWPGNVPNSWHGNAYFWPGYIIYTAFITDDGTRRPCDPTDGGQTVMSCSPENWKKGSPMRVTDHPRHPIIGDTLYYRNDDWPWVVHVVKHATDHWAGSHIDGEKFYEPINPGTPVDDVLAPHNFAFGGGSVRSYKTGFIKHMHYFNRSYRYWHLRD